MSEAFDRLAEGYPVIFFDGVCGLCNAFVDWLIVRDQKHVFRFATLQGETAKRLLRSLPGADAAPDSVVLYADGVTHYQSRAVGLILKRLNGIYPALGLALRLTPTPFANFGYDLVARHRYRLFGKRHQCRLPLANERALFLP